MELNATNVEVIVGTIIEEANNGKIDLNGFSSFWTFIKQKVLSYLGSVETEFQTIESACQRTNHTNRRLTCTECVCMYRNNVIEDAIEHAEETLELAKETAQEVYETDLTPYIFDFMADVVLEWKHNQVCEASHQQEKSMPEDLQAHQDICDLSAIELITPGSPISLDCQMMFACGEIIVDANGFNIVAESLFLGDNTRIENVKPPKAENGADGVEPGENGKDGAPGLPAFNMTLTIKSLMLTSDQSISFVSEGGDGGNGGKGQEGKSNMDQLPEAPADAKEVFDRGVNDPNHDPDLSEDKQECCCVLGICVSTCKTHDNTFYRILDIVSDTEACGGNGGNGGNGGPGGAAGTLTIDGPEGLEAFNNRQGSRGGNPGSGSLGAYGIKANRHYKGNLRTYETGACFGDGLCQCQVEIHSEYKDYNADTSRDTPCNGEPGINGNPGEDWEP